MKHYTLLVWCAVFALSLWEPRALAESGAKPSAPGPRSASIGAPSTAPQPGPTSLGKARHLVTWMVVRSDQIQHWLRVARQQQQRSRSRCLDSQLSQAHAVERRGEVALQAIKAAVQSGRLHEIEPQLARLEICDEHSRRLLRQANVCGRTPVRSRKPPASRTHARRLR